MDLTPHLQLSIVLRVLRLIVAPYGARIKRVYMMLSEAGAVFLQKYSRSSEVHDVSFT